MWRRGNHQAERQGTSPTRDHEVGPASGRGKGDVGRKVIWSILAPAIVLIIAVVAQATPHLRKQPGPRSVQLSVELPRDLLGWESREVPLGPSEFMANTVEKMLNYDDVVNREYTKGGQTFGVFVVYWSAGKMPTQVVASHTPDRCWTENGWRCVEMKFREPQRIDGLELQPAEWRLFVTPDGAGQSYVLYWHLVGGRIYDYGERFNSIPDPLRWWKDALQQVVLGSREQVFIRITSAEPFEKLKEDAGFRQLLHRLSQLGLAAGTADAART